MSIDGIPHTDELRGPIPSATYFRVYRCNDCTHVHVVLFDADDVAFAQFTIGRHNLDRLTGDGERVFAMVERREPLRS